MKKFKKYAASKAGRDTLLSFGIVIAGYIYPQAAMVATGNISACWKACRADLRVCHHGGFAPT